VYGLRVHYRLSSKRNWATLWRPTIDALGPILGLPNSRRSFHPNDDRIVDLALTKTVDNTIGWDIHLTVVWTTGAP